MKIFVVMHTFSNYGGIINHNEQLILGLKELGHEVTFAYVKPTSVLYKKTDSTIPSDYDIGPGTGYPIHQEKGWIAPYYSFKNNESIHKFIEDANKHDILIWQSIFGFKNPNTEQYSDWIPMIENVNCKQIVVIHDANLKKLYPWINFFKHKFSGIACVHTSAFKSADSIDVPRNIILNPMDIEILPQVPVKERKKQIFSLQTFKRMKRVDNLVAAIPYLNCNVIIGGDGIERHYMTSKDKCKEEYRCTKETDPDAQSDRLGKRIWENALNTNRMEYIGFINENKRDQIMSESKFFIDTSWSKSYGEHFNRTMLESFRVGTVPIARNLGVSDNEDGNGLFLRPNENYLMIPYNTTPKQFAEYVNNFFEIDIDDYQRIVHNNYNLLKMFDRKVIAQQYIDLANNKDTGYYPKNSIGSPNSDFDILARKMWESHFSKSSSLEGFF